MIGTFNKFALWPGETASHTRTGRWFRGILSARPFRSEDKAMGQVKKERTNRGWFKRGHDPRRHKFTRDECVEGFWAALESISTRYPDVIDHYGRHMSCAFLNKRRKERTDDRNES
jgi:hypothetical protein